MVLCVMSVFAMAQFVSASEVAGLESFAIDGKPGLVPFFYYPPPAPGKSTALLLLLPGFNGSGAAMLDERWRRFADEHHLVLLAPTFTSSNPEELHHHQGYYYPELGSGKVIEEALTEVHHRTGAPIDQILIFGFSAGAHVGHRFALWNPARVKAFVAYSAGWWSEPNESLHNVPALIMCGESDERFEATRAFFQKGLALNLPWIWRSYKNTAHQLTPPVRTMSEVFLSYYAKQMKGGSESHANSSSNISYGDIQTYRVVPESDKESIPEIVRVLLPSPQIAEVWMREN